MDKFVEQTARDIACLDIARAISGGASMAFAEAPDLIPTQGGDFVSSKQPPSISFHRSFFLFFPFEHSLKKVIANRDLRDVYPRV